MMQKLTLDKIFIVLGITYLTLPICVFLMGWLKTPLNIMFTLAILYFAITAYRKLSKKEICIINKKNLKYWLIAVVLLGTWLYFSGIGGFAYQNDDFWARNAIYRDLSTYGWPVVYDLSLEPDYVVSVLGTGNAIFSYYYVFWLPIALISKVLSLSETLRNILLFIDAYIGLLLIVYFVNRKFNKCLYLVPILLITFSGLDLIGFFINNGYMSLLAHIEWWINDYFQYSSNTTLLYWVFNQAIPVWLIMSLFIQDNDNSIKPGLCALCFAYSPWATIGTMPFLLCSAIKERDFKNVFSISNILTCLTMIIVFVSFYYCGTRGQNNFHLIFTFFKNSKPNIVYAYILFIILEFLVYYFVIGKDIFKYEYSITSLLTLCFIPMIVDDTRNFAMRASIPALFILMIIVISYLNEYGFKNIRTKILTIILLIASYTPFTEIYRSIYNTFNFNEYIIKDDVKSFGCIEYNADDMIYLINDNFLIDDYQDSFFYKHLMQK